MVFVTLVHGIIVVGSIISLPMVLLFPGTRWYFFAGAVVVLLTWSLMSNCPLTLLDEGIRRRLGLKSVDGDFLTYYVQKFTGMRIDARKKHVAEKVYLVVVVLVILIR